MDSQVCNRDLSANFASLVGLPFVEGGRDHLGLDCVGLLNECYRMMGVRIPPKNSGKNIAENAVLISHHTSEVWTEIEKAEHVAVCFRLGRVVCHVGFTLPGGRFIHTWEGSKGVVIERLRDWEHRVAGYYDYQV